MLPPERRSRASRSRSISPRRRRGGEKHFPDQPAGGHVGEGELDDRIEPPGKGLVEVLPEVRGQDRYAIELLHLLEQEGDLDVRVAIVSVVHFRAFPPERVGFVEEEDRIRVDRGVEDLPKVFLGLPNVLAHDPREIDLVKIQMHLRGDDRGGRRLARAGRSAEEGVGARVPRDFLPESPFVAHAMLVADLLTDLLELELRIGTEDQVVPAVDRVNPATRRARAWPDWARAEP